MILPKHHGTQYLQKKYEPETFKKIKYIFKNYKIKSFWDIGSNAGMYSVFIARKYSCKINAFEPVRKYHELLKHNTYQFHNVFTHNFGIARSDNEKKIILTKEPGSNYIQNNNLEYEEKNFENCKLRSIKNLTGIQAPDFAKIDVEGYEYEILESSIDFFKSNNTILIIEIEEKNLERYSKNKKNIFNILTSRNYKIERISNSNNYLCILKNAINNESQNEIWLELVGIWGSGKTTIINNFKNEFKNKTKFKTTHDFFKLKKRKRLLYTTLNIFKNLDYCLPIIIILSQKYIIGVLKKDTILISEIRSFFYCFFARLYSRNNLKKKCFLWEGEFHLIPLIDLSIKQKELIITILLNLNISKSLIFVVLETSISDAINMIEKDQLSGKKKRFNSHQFKYFKEYIIKSLKNQDEMLDILDKKGFKIYRTNKSKVISFNKIKNEINN